MMTMFPTTTAQTLVEEEAGECWTDYSSALLRDRADASFSSIVRALVVYLVACGAGVASMTQCGRGLGTP